MARVGAPLIKFPIAQKMHPSRSCWEKMLQCTKACIPKSEPMWDQEMRLREGGGGEGGEGGGGGGGEGRLWNRAESLMRSQCDMEILPLQPLQSPLSVGS